LISFIFDLFSNIGYNMFMKDKEYNRLYSSLKADILGRHYAAGQRIPAERQLCREYGVSRITVRHALSLLEKDGLVEKFQGKGSFIKDTKPAKLPITDAGFARSVSHHAPNLYRTLLKNETIKAPVQIRNLLALQTAECFHALRVDVIDQSPVAFDRVYIRGRYSLNIDEELLKRIDFFEQWTEKEGITIQFYNETIEALEADDETSDILKIQPAGAVLKTTETYYKTGDIPIAVFESYYRADKVKLTSTIKNRK
jgi:DNA-binding GntR family transcriptional regulator